MAKEYYNRTIKHHYEGRLRGLGAQQVLRQRGFKGTTLGPANSGRQLSTAERKAVEQKMREEGLLGGGSEIKRI